MFQKKFKQFLAATLSAAMVIGQVQYANAADVELNDTEFSEEVDLAPVEDAPELTDEEIAEYIDSEEEFFDGDVALEDAEDTFEEFGDEDFTDEVELLDDASEEEADFEEEATENLSTEMPEGVVGMPEDYELTDSELSIKEDSIANKDTYLDAFASLAEGTDYARDEVVFLAESQEHAEEVAAAYAGVLKSYENGVAVIDLTDSEVTVEAAYACAFIEGLNLPVVTPNYFFGNGETAQEDESHLGAFNTANTENAVTENAETESSEEASAETWEDADDEDDGEIYTTATTVGVVELADSEAADSEAEAETEVESVNEPYLDSASNEYQWQHAMVNSYDAFVALGKDGLSKTSNVVVAVIDDGIADVSELNLVNAADYDGNHGTQVAGVIGATLNENAGAGIAPGVQLLNLKSELTSASVMTQLRAAVAADADVINLSFAGAGVDAQLASVVAEVYDAGVTMVASVGNGSVSYPAAFENVIAVTAVNEAGEVAAFVADASAADVAAPGANIYTTDVDGSYVRVSGSDIAAPVVTGAVALYMSQYGHIAPETMRAVLVNSADVKDSISVVNVRSLLETTTGNVRAFNTTNVNAVTTKTKKITFTSNRGTVVKNKFTVGTVNSGAIYTSATFTATADNSAPITWTWPASAEKKAVITTSGRNVTVSVRAGAKPGTIKLKAAGNKKKVTLSVKIINPVAGTLDFQYPANQYKTALANGGYYKVKAKAQGAGGLKPTKKTIKWTAIVKVGGYTLSTKEAKKVATVSGGKVSCKKGSIKWLEKNYGTSTAVIYPIAYSTDGTNWVWQFQTLNNGNPWALSVVRRPRTPFGFRNGATYDISKNSSPAAYYKFTYTVRRGWFTVSESVTYIECHTPVYVESSNTNILKVSCVQGKDDAGRTAYYVQFAPQGRSGTARVTVKTLDGTHLSTSAFFKCY